MKKFTRIILSLAIFASISGAVVTLESPQVVFAKDCASDFLGFPAWYKGLTDSNCNIVAPTNISDFVWRVVLNCLDIIFMATGYIATFFILFAGFKLILSLGKPDAWAEARKTIVNASIGLVIAVAAVAIINIILGII